MTRGRRGTEGFTLVEVILATAIFFILLAGLSGAISRAMRMNGEISTRARLEAAASRTVFQLVQGFPGRPGLLAARTILEPSLGTSNKLAFQTEPFGPAYEYWRDPGGQLVFTVNGRQPVTLLDNVAAFTVTRERLGGHLVVRIAVEVALPRPGGASRWTLVALAVPRNAR